MVDTAPWDGRKPKIPQNDAGILTHPVVSVPTKTQKSTMFTNIVMQSQATSFQGRDIMACAN